MVFFRILNLAGPDRSRMFRSIIFKVIESFFAVAPLVIAYLAVAALMGDRSAQSILVFPMDSSEGIFLVAGLLLASYALQWLFFLLNSRDSYGAGQRIAARLRLRIAKHLTRLPMTYFRKNDSGELAHVLMQDVMAIEQVPGLVLPRLVVALTLPVIAFVATFVLDWRMGLALVAGLPLALPALVWGHRGLKQAAADHGRSAARMNSRLIEFIRGIAVIKSFGLAADRGGQCIRAVDDFRDASKAITYKFVLPTIFFPACLAIGCGAGLAIGAHFLLTGSLDPAAYLLFFLIGLRLYGPLVDLMDFSALIRQMETAMERVTDILKQDPEAIPETDCLPSDYDVVFSGVSFKYAVETAGGLDGVSFTCGKNRMLALVGATGAGKSTVARLLSGQYAPDAGRITIGGMEIRDLSRSTLNKLVSIVSQDVFLFTESVRDNIRLGRADATDEQIIEAAKAARCHDFIMSLESGYDTILENGGAQLSGGERQRIALARAFLQDSKILVLDEVTSALDVENEHLVQEALTELVQNRTVIVIAHRLWTVRHADEILVLDGGRIVESGYHDQLVKAGGRYYTLWQYLENAPGWSGRRSKAA